MRAQLHYLLLDGFDPDTGELGLRVRVDALEAQVLALILVNEVPFAALVLGGKYSELNYGHEDRELLREVVTATGLLLVPAGTRLGLSHLEKLRNYARLAGIREPIAVIARA